MTIRPDQHTIRDAIALASRAPSVHNTQPWHWFLGESSLHLVADQDRRLPVTDPTSRDLMISCGATLHHLRVALAALGWHAKIHRIPNPTDPNHLATIDALPHEPTHDDITLAAAIPLRRTDRRRYSSRPVPPDHLDLMVHRTTQAGAILIPITDPTRRHQLTQAITTAATEQDHNPAYRTELTYWSGRTHTAHDGILAASTPTGPPTHGDTKMRAFPHSTLTTSAIDSREADAGELLILATPDDHALSWLHAGEATSAALLTATQLGLATCPLSQPLEVGATRTTIRDELLGGAAEPHLIIRTGWAHPSTKLPPPSVRRPLHEILSYLPGTRR